MTRRTAAHPDLTRPDVEAPFFSTWRVGTPERQRRTVEAIARTWERRDWPGDGLRSYHVYAGHDGETLLHHSQWASEAAYEAFVKTRRQERVDEIDTAVPGIERLGLGRYRRHGGLAREAGDSRVPGLVTTARADRAEPVEREPGLISAHVHLSTDGTHVLTYAEWAEAAPAPRGLVVSRYEHALGLVPG
ncbi:hypothetical protein AB0G32_10405 [Streptomyces sp. NPDC023723]|uniref:hypothetical protein n=1 Tax=Streptomyces sp. NPDC023723 TaxID=3154323 RepID=UPI003410ADBD